MNKAQTIQQLQNIIIQTDILGKKLINEGIRLGQLPKLQDEERRTLGFKYLEHLRNELPFCTIRNLIYDVNESLKKEE